MVYSTYSLVELKAAVARAEADYIKAHDARQPSTALWNEYVWLLHMFRLRKRSMRNG